MKVHLSEVHVNCFDTQYIYCIYKVLYLHSLWFHLTISVFPNWLCRNDNIEYINMPAPSDIATCLTTSLKINSKPPWQMISSFLIIFNRFEYLVIANTTQIYPLSTIILLDNAIPTRSSCCKRKHGILEILCAENDLKNASYTSIDFLMNLFVRKTNSLWNYLSSQLKEIMVKVVQWTGSTYCSVHVSEFTHGCPPTITCQDSVFGDVCIFLPAHVYNTNPVTHDIHDFLNACPNINIEHYDAHEMPLVPLYAIQDVSVWWYMLILHSYEGHMQALLAQLISGRDTLQRRILIDGHILEAPTVVRSNCLQNTALSVH